MRLQSITKKVSVVGLLLPEETRKNLFARLRDWRTEYLPDRRYLKRTVFPALAALHPSRLMNIGVQAYNRIDARAFARVGCEYWTSDIAAEAAQFGAPNRHIVADVRHIADHFQSDFFDVVLLNGVLGHGCNGMAAQEEALASIYSILGPDGVLVVGWNQGTTVDPLELPALSSLFTHGGVRGLPQRMDVRRSNHTFDFFMSTKPRKAARAA